MAPTRWDNITWVDLRETIENPVPIVRNKSVLSEEGRAELFKGLLVQFTSQYSREVHTVTKRDTMNALHILMFGKQNVNIKPKMLFYSFVNRCMIC